MTVDTDGTDATALTISCALAFNSKGHFDLPTVIFSLWFGSTVPDAWLLLSWLRDSSSSQQDPVAISTHTIANTALKHGIISVTPVALLENPRSKRRSPCVSSAFLSAFNSFTKIALQKVMFYLSPFSYTKPTINFVVNLEKAENSFFVASYLSISTNVTVPKLLDRFR